MKLDSTSASSSRLPSMPSAERRLRLEQIFLNNRELVWRLLRRLGVSRDDVEDAVQQVFLIAAERLDDVRGASESSFVYGTAVRVAASHRRRAAREICREAFDSEVSPLPGPAELADRERAWEALDLTLSRMKEELRVAFVMFEIEGLTTPEIAALTGAPLGTAASRLRRARESFRRLIRSGIAGRRRSHV